MRRKGPSTGLLFHFCWALKFSFFDDQAEKKVFRLPHLVHLLVDWYVVVDPLVVVVHSHRQSLLGRLLTNNVVVQVLVNFLGVRGWLSACLLP